MSKSTVTRMFFGAIAAVVAGWVLGIVAFVLALANGAIVIGGPNIVTVNGGPFASALAVLAIAAVLMGGGTIVGVLSWFGALVATSHLEDKTWFLLLLLLGLWSFGFIAMIAYVIAGPDPASQGAPGRGVATAQGG
jgi:hypothetical protein